MASRKEVTEFDADVSEKATSSAFEKVLDTIPETEIKMKDIKNEKSPNKNKNPKLNHGNDQNLQKLESTKNTTLKNTTSKNTTLKNTCDYHQTVSNINAQNYCFICKSGNTQDNVMESGIVYCQECLCRKQHFLMGQSLACYKCEKKLGSGSGEVLSSDFEHWNGHNYCKRCVFVLMRESGIVRLE